MNTHLHVRWWDGSTVGHLVNRGSIYFVYDEAWISRGLNLSPLSLPFEPIAFNGHKGIDGLPGLLADCLPDAWGRKVARREFAEHKWGEPTTLSLLAWRSTRGIGALDFVPALSDRSSRPTRFETISAGALARGAAEIERGEPTEVLGQLARGGTAGGAFPKALVLAYPDDTLRVGAPDDMGVPSLLKFDLSPQADQAPAEHIYARMAHASGIRTVTTRLINGDSSSNRRHLLVERFDIRSELAPGQRLHVHSASGLLHRDSGALDYRDLFRTAIRLGLPPSELNELARRMVFNVLSANHDDHGKNHAFMLDENTHEWSLTPAFDLTYSAGILERGTLIQGEVWPGRKTMETLCADAGVRDAEFTEIWQAVSKALDLWPELAREFNLPKLKTSEIQDRLTLIRERVGS